MAQATKQPIIIDGAVNILTEITPLEGIFDYRSDSKMAGKQYCRFTYLGTVFIAPPELQTDLKAGRVSKIILTESTEEVTFDNPDTGNSETALVKRIAYVKHVTSEALIRAYQAEAEIKRTALQLEKLTQIDLDSLFNEVPVAEGMEVPATNE